MELSVYKIDGTLSGKKVVLDEKVFGVEPNDHVIYLDVLQYLAAQRQGTAKTKDRSEVAYSTKKLGRQKGGGGARHGSLKAGIFVGGGNVFGPKPRDYRTKLNKKLKSLARISALSYTPGRAAQITFSKGYFYAGARAGSGLMIRAADSGRIGRWSGKRFFADCDGDGVLLCGSHLIVIAASREACSNEQ